MRRIFSSISGLCVGLVAVAFLFFLAVRGEGTTDVGFSVSTHEASGIYFLDESHGWISMIDHGKDHGYLFYTDNGGKTWRGWRTPKDIEQLYFLTPNIGWALRPNHGTGAVYLVRSNDGGKHWHRVSSGPIIAKAQRDGVLMGLAFLDSRTGWFVGSGPLGSPLVLATIDGGRTVSKVTNLPKSLGSCLGICVGKSIGIWIYGEGFVLHSADRGRTWKNAIDFKEIGTNSHAFNISSGLFRNDGNGWLIGQDPDGTILKTTDFGVHWSVSLDSKKAGNFRGLSFWDSLHGCAASFYPTLLFCTADGGRTWNAHDVLPQAGKGQAQFFTNLVMLSDGRGWIVRGGGYLYETTDAGQTWHNLALLANVNVICPQTLRTGSYDVRPVSEPLFLLKNLPG